jgi:hypothetical protein
MVEQAYKLSSKFNFTVGESDGGNNSRSRVGIEACNVLHLDKLVHCQTKRDCKPTTAAGIGLARSVLATFRNSSELVARAVALKSSKLPLYFVAGHSECSENTNTITPSILLRPNILRTANKIVRIHSNVNYGLCYRIGIRSADASPPVCPLKLNINITDETQPCH